MKKSTKIVGLALSMALAIGGGATASGYTVASYAFNKTEQIVQEERQNSYNLGYKEGSANIPAKDQQINNLKQTIKELEDYIATLSKSGYGLYDEDNNHILTWYGLLNNNVLVVEDGILNVGTNSSELEGKTLIIPDTVSKIKGYAFRNTQIKKVIADNLIEISPYAFAGCSTLTVFSAKNATLIDACAFMDCSALTTINIPNVEIIKSNSFRECISLENINLENAKTIEKWVFWGDTNLKSVVLNNNTLSLGSNIFGGCSSLKSLYLPIYTNFDFDGENQCFSNCSSDLVIYCGFNLVPETWSDTWNYYSKDDALTTKYGYTYEQYLAEINTGENT